MSKRAEYNSTFINLLTFCALLILTVSVYKVTQNIVWTCISCFAQGVAMIVAGLHDVEKCINRLNKDKA